MLKKISALLLVALFTLIFSVTALAATPAAPATEAGFYSADYAGVLSETTEAAILSANQALRSATGGEIVVVTTDFTGSKSIEDYAKDIGNDWGVGSAKYNNGMVLVISVGEDDYYCAVGTGFNSLVGKLKTILNTDLEPDFAAKNYDAGVLKCFNSLVGMVKESGIGGEEYVKDNSYYTFGGFRQYAAGGMAYAAIGVAGAFAIIMVMLLFVALISGFMFAGRRRRLGFGRMPLWPFLFMGGRGFFPFGGFGHRGPPGGFGGGGFSGGFGGGGGFSGGGAGRG